MKWFKHETDAHTNLKLQNVVDTLGLGAYGYYWMCVELVGLQGENFRLRPEKNWKNYLKKLSGLSLEQQQPFLDLFADINLIDRKSLNRGILYIPKLEERQDDYTKKVRRMYGQDTDNVHLEEKRIDKNRIEEIRDVDTPSTQADEFFKEGAIYTDIRNTLVQKLPEPLVDQNLKKFILYWTEPNKSGTKVRWQLQRTFDVKRRLYTWLDRAQSYQGASRGKGIII